MVALGGMSNKEKCIEIDQWLVGCELHAIDIYIQTCDKTINYNGDRTLNIYDLDGIDIVQSLNVDNSYYDDYSLTFECEYSDIEIKIEIPLSEIIEIGEN